MRARPNTISSTSGSRDLQMVNVSLRVLTRPDAGKLQDIYRTLGTDYDQRVLPSIIQETLKGVIAQYNASQLLTQRELVSKDIRRMLTERAARFNIVLEDVSITNLTFSREYTAAVEAKQVQRLPLPVHPFHTCAADAQQDVSPLGSFVSVLLIGATTQRECHGVHATWAKALSRRHMDASECGGVCRWRSRMQRGLSLIHISEPTRPY